jgi:hypothetical protein
MAVVDGSVFLGEEDGLAGQAMAQAVETGPGFAFGGAGTGGFLCVFPVGVELGLRDG